MLLCILGPGFSSTLQAQITDIRDCAGSCMAADVTVTHVFVAQANQNPLPSCIPGNTTSGTIFIEIENGSNGNRGAIRFAADLFINGVDSGADITFCNDGPLSAGGSSILSGGTITWTCGQQ
ncbi:MAG: hypothetical protein KF852_10125 [Saprospiraceae bacterium]|nr:hypothetical protein [Saprospiraceae bacterium]